MSICGNCGEYKSSITLWMPPHWTAARSERCFSVDACIASEMAKLIYHYGVRTVNCCCGHGVDDGMVIVNQDEKTKNTMQQLGYERANGFTASGDIFYVIPKERIKHIGPNPQPGD